MCGRYNLIIDGDSLAESLDIQQSFEFKARYNIAPSQMAPVIRMGEQGRELVMMKWGLLPHWSKEEKLKYSTINARAETVAEKPTFRTPFKRSRCLVPATGFYEWKAEVSGPKQPYLIRKQDRKLMVFSGLWDHWEKEGQVIDSYTIIVTQANQIIRNVHDRMPVILNSKNYDEWLDPSTQVERLHELMGPSPDSLLDLTPISRHVNSPAHDDPACLS